MPWSNTVNNFKNSVPAPRHCFIVGATGEVGKCLLQQVLSSNAFDKVVVLTRRSVAYTGPNKDLIVSQSRHRSGAPMTTVQFVLSCGHRRSMWWTALTN